MNQGVVMGAGLRIWAATAALALIAGSGASARDTPQARSFAIPSHGRLTLRLPSGYRARSRPIPTPPSVYVEIGPSSGDDFNLQVTAVWLDSTQLARARTSLKAGVQDASRGPAAQSVEKDVTIQDIPGVQGAGYFYSLTDKAPGPGEYKYMSQGTLVTGEVMVTFTLLQHRDDAGQRSAVLAGIASMAHDPTAPASEGMVMREQGDTLLLTVEPSRLRLGLPNPNHSLTSQPSLGGGPRYFQLEDSKASLIVSGWFEPAGGFSTIEQFWSTETAEWKKNGLPAPRDVEFADAAGFKCVFYDIAIQGSVLSHVRAHRVEAGTWIDLHVSSKATDSPGEGRKKLKAFLVGVRVTQK